MNSRNRFVGGTRCRGAFPGHSERGLTMQDQHFIRQWTDVHDDFTADLHQALNQIGRYQRTRHADIGSTYALLDKYAEQQAPRPALSPAAQASLRGLAASVI